MAHPVLRPYVKPLLVAPTNTWSVSQLCVAYAWPRHMAGGGTIAIIELGGGYHPADITAYFKSIGYPPPVITDISVDGTQNTPGHSDADIEVALDIEVAGASYGVATGRAAEIRVYWTSDLPTAVMRAAEDGCAVCSISWGADEAQWGHNGCEEMQAAAKYATALGMMILAAAGDNDSSDGDTTPANVDCPSSCPDVVGCGGTTKRALNEVVWNNDPGQATGNGTGGGYSRVFTPVPDWQVGAPPPPIGRGRMVPDIAANADPRTGYEIWVRGERMIVGGTSAVAPLYAGLFASFGALRLGHEAVDLWAHPECFVDIVMGNNGRFHARMGPDACTGLGVPNGTAIAKLVTGT